MSLAKIFVSYTDADRQEAKRLSKRLKRRGFDIFNYRATDSSSRIDFGQPISETVRKNLETSDFIICIATEQSRSSEGVKEELKLAAELKQSRGRPGTIVYVTAGGEDFALKPGQVFAGQDLTTLNICDLRNRTQFGLLLSQFKLKVKRIESPDAHDRELFANTYGIMAECFPEEEGELPSRQAILNWLTYFSDASPRPKWSDVLLAAYHEQNSPVGFVYLGIPKQRHYDCAFVTHVGIKKPWQGHYIFRQMMSETLRLIRKDFRHISGLFFEVAACDTHGPAKDVECRRCTNLTKFRAFRALTLVDAKTELPVAVPQPPTDSQMPGRSANKYHLMYYPLKGQSPTTIDAKRLFEIWLDNYSEGFGNDTADYVESKRTFEAKYGPTDSSTWTFANVR